MRQQFLNAPQDIEWLRSTHLRKVAHVPTFRSFVLEGNEDYPTRIVLYRDSNPRFDARPVAMFNAATLNHEDN